jgi:hypothetical protein
LSPFLGPDNRNLLLIGFMALSPALVLAKRITRDQLILYIFMLTITLFPPLVSPGYVRWSTIFYTLMFAVSFIAYTNILRASRLTIERFTSAIRILLLAYFVVFLVQQLGVLTGLPIINESNYSAVRRWSVNALAAEPSHTARFVNLLILAYLLLEEIRLGEKYNLKRRLWADRFIWLGYAWISITIGSVTALLFIPIIFSKIMNQRNFLFVSVVVIILVLTLTQTSNVVFDRASRFVEALATFDHEALMSADHSGSLRFAPLLVLSAYVELFSVQGMFGHGVDTVSQFMTNYIRGVPEGYTGGGMLRVWYEYGFISFALFIAFTMRVGGALRSVPNLAFWFLIVFISGPNNQILWMYLIVFASINHFRIMNVDILRAPSLKR